MAQDSGGVEFWDVRYRDGVMPWDSAGYLPEDFRRFAAQQAPGARVLLPGCGSAYELLHLLQLGMRAEGIDFSMAAIEAARRQLGEVGSALRLADFFAEPETHGYDWVYERAFLCALPPELRPAYVCKMAGLLAPEGRLAGYFFVVDKPKGPPYGMTRDALLALLGDRFELREERSVGDSLPVFAGHEFWMEWAAK